jgi:hypothetical protein
LKYEVRASGMGIAEDLEKLRDVEKFTVPAVAKEIEADAFM